MQLGSTVRGHWLHTGWTSQPPFQIRWRSAKNCGRYRWTTDPCNDVSDDTVTTYIITWGYFSQFSVVSISAKIQDLIWDLLWKDFRFWEKMRFEIWPCDSNIFSRRFEIWKKIGIWDLPTWLAFNTNLELPDFYETNEIFAYAGNALGMDITIIRMSNDTIKMFSVTNCKIHRIKISTHLKALQAGWALHRPRQIPRLFQIFPRGSNIY